MYCNTTLGEEGSLSGLSLERVRWWWCRLGMKCGWGCVMRITGAFQTSNCANAYQRFLGIHRRLIASNIEIPA